MHGHSLDLIGFVIATAVAVLDHVLAHMPAVKSNCTLQLLSRLVHGASEAVKTPASGIAEHVIEGAGDVAEHAIESQVDPVRIGPKLVKSEDAPSQKDRAPNSEQQTRVASQSANPQRSEGSPPSTPDFGAGV